MPDGKIRILIVDDIPEARENIAKLLYFEKDMEVVGTASDGEQSIQMAKSLLPDVILMDINLPGMDGITAAEVIHAQVPSSQLIMMSVQEESAYLRRAMLAGAREFLIKPFSGDELVNGIRRVYELEATRRAAMPAVVPGPPPAAAALPVQGQIITVFSPKGGTGCTTLASNLAVAIRQETGKRVLLIDGNFQFGDVGMLLNLQTNKSILDLLGEGEQVDEELLEGTILEHPSGIRVLLGPPHPEMAELVTAGHMKHILAAVKKTYDYVLIDAWNSLHDLVLAIFDLSDKILLVTTAELTAIKDTKLFFDVVEALGYPPEKIVLVLNRLDGRGGISLPDIQGAIKHPVAMAIPNDWAVANYAINQGVPFAMSQKDSHIGKAVGELAQIIAGEREEKQRAPAKKGTGLLSLLRGQPSAAKTSR